MRPLILQMFAAHWTTVAGMRKLNGMNDPDLPVRKHVTGLGLAAAAISIPICHRSMLTIFMLNGLSYYFVMVSLHT